MLGAVTATALRTHGACGVPETFALRLRRVKAACVALSTTSTVLKMGEDSMIKWLAYIINIVWIKKTIPDDWRRGIILPLWKNT